MKNTKSLDILREILPLPYRIVVDGEPCVVIRKSEFDLLIATLHECCVPVIDEEIQGSHDKKRP